MSNFSLRTLWVFLLTLVFAASVVAQTTGTIRGQIKDQEGGALPGATVTATSTDRGTSRTVISGESGQFAFLSLAVGTYHVTAVLEGFQEQVVKEVRVGISSAANLEMTLALQDIQDVITVTSGAAVLDVSSSSVGTNFGSEFLEKLPTNRNWWDMLAVAPGVSQQSEESTSMSAFGSGVTSNSWSVDGLNTTNADTGESFWWLNPDTIDEIQILAIGAPAQYGNMSGAAFNVVTKSGSNQLKGTANFYYQDDSLTSTNAEINGIPFRRDNFTDLTVSLGGPILRDKLWFFAAYQDYSEGRSEPGEDPEHPSDNVSNKIDVKLNMQLTASMSMDAKYHYEDWDFAWTDAYYTLDAAGSNNGTNPAWGISLDSVLGTNNLLEVSYSGYSATQNYESRTGSVEDPFIDQAPPGGGPWLYSGSLWYPYVWDIFRDQAQATLSTHAEDFLMGDHEFKFGVSYGRGDGDTVTAGGPNGVYYYRNEYINNYYGYEYVYEYFYRATARAYHYGAETTTLSAFIDDSWQVTNNLTINVGVRYDSISSDIPDYDLLDTSWNRTGEKIPGIKNAVDWKHVSPRIGFSYQTGERGVLRGFYGKFYDGDVTGNWYAPPPNPPTYLYEYSTSLDGPWEYYYEWDWHSNTIDPNLKPPETDQYALGYEFQVGSHMAIGLQGIYKKTKNLIGWEILDDGVYEMVPWVNPFTGETEMLASIIEQPSTRKGNRPGAGSLAPPGERFHQDFKGATLTFNKRYSDGWSMQASYTWSDSNGFLPKPTSEVQGDPFYTGTDGRDPNNWLNAKQALQNEREHVLQVQSAFELPWGFTGSVVYRYLDGKPYNRQLSVGGMGSQTPLDQGQQTVIAIPAESSTKRPASNILDMGLGRVFPMGPVDLKLDVKLLNAFNDDAHDWWQTLNVPPGEQYIPKGYVMPRRWALQLGLSF